MRSHIFSLLLLLLLISCEEKKSQVTVGDTSQIQHDTSTPEAPPAPKEVDRWTAGILERDYGPREIALLGDIRTSTQEQYDRIVFVFRSASLPSWHIEYIDKPVRSCGSGDVVPLVGESWLEIRMTPANTHAEAGHATTFRQQQFSYRNLLEMKLTCDFEAVTTYVAGLRSPKKYRVLELTDPTRLVVDIQN